MLALVLVLVLGFVFVRASPLIPIPQPDIMEHRKLVGVGSGPGRMPMDPTSSDLNPPF